jgi:hypothetical protein
MVQAIIREAKKELRKLNQLQGYKEERERRPQIEIDRAMSSMETISLLIVFIANGLQT